MTYLTAKLPRHLTLSKRSFTFQKKNAYQLSSVRICAPVLFHRVDNAKLRDRFSLRGIFEKYVFLVYVFVDRGLDIETRHQSKEKQKRDVGETQCSLWQSIVTSRRQESPTGDPCTRAGWGEDVQGGIRKSNMTGVTCDRGIPPDSPAVSTSG